MKKGIYFITVILLASCSQSADTKQKSTTDKIVKEAIKAEEPTRTKRDSINVPEEAQPEAPKQLASFSGNWFTIDYPQNFTPSPKRPMSSIENYRFVETDEAKFTSPDETVEFFVFSPQWGGDPIDYLIEQPNEKTVASSEELANSNDPFEPSHHWVTYEDKDGKYTRSYHSLMTESTHHVFGVKYTNRKMYERYKADYLAFKKSLQQFAD